MVVGLCTVNLLLTDSFSLKDKRQVLKSLITRIRTKFNVSITEIDHHDRWQRAQLAIACVSTSQKFADQILHKVVDMIEQEPRVLAEQVSIEML